MSADDIYANPISFDDLLQFKGLTPLPAARILKATRRDRCIARAPSIPRLAAGISA